MESLHKKTVFSFTFFLLITTALFSQKGSQTAGGVTDVNLFTLSAHNENYDDIVAKAVYLKLNLNALQQVIQQRPFSMNFIIPTGPAGESVTLSLEQYNLFSPGFKVTTPERGEVAYTPGLYYQGKVAGDPRSIVAISLFQDMVMGIVSTDEGDFVLGHTNQDIFPISTEYVYYNDRNLKVLNPFDCVLLDATDDGSDGELAQNKTTILSNPVDVYFEADYDLYVSKGSSTTTTTNYVTGLYNQCIAIYNAEDISTAISQVVVWSTPDPYPSSSSSAALDAFRLQTGTSFNGDIAHLVANDPGGLGGVAYLDVLCNRLYSKAYSDINTTYSSFPTYSWTVEVVTHEMGHNLGSPHTHGCSWGPNENGAIDGCGPAAGYSEGCSASLPPAGGGTIMSYCHLVGSVGINFNNGFGLLPGNKIRYEIANASCLLPAGSHPDLTKTGTDVLTVNGSVVNLQHTVRNNGSVGSGAFKVGYYLTPNTTLSTGDYLIGTLNFPSGLAANTNSSLITFIVDPDTIANIPNGTFYVGYIIDHEYKVTESNENNNSFRITSPTVSLSDVNVTCSMATVLGNGNYTVGQINTGNGCYNCSGGATHARWYKFICTQSGYIDAISCNGGVNTRLWVYTGSCGSLTQVFASDDDCAISSGGANTAARLYGFPVVAGSTYYLEWDNRWSSSGFSFFFSFYKDGEHCNVATTIANGAPYPKSISVNGPSSGNGASHSDATHADWYKWTAPSSGTIDVASCNAGVDTRLWVYGGTCGSLVQLGASDDDCQMSPGGQLYASEVNNIPVVGGTTYYVEWDDIWSQNSFFMHFDFSPGVPSCTQLTSPVNGATNVDINADLFWAPATGAPTGYKLTVGTTPGGGQILNNVNVGNVTTYDPGPYPAGKTIYVKIVPYNAAGDATGCAEESFSVQGSPPPPVPNCTTLSNPVNGATNIPITSDLTWNAATGAPTGYKLTVGYTPGGGQIMNNVNVGNVTTYNPPGNFNYNATVYVRIVPYNANGDAVGCIEESFTTQIAPPNCTTLSNPANGATNVAVTSALTWNAATGAPTGYKLTVGTSPGGGQILNNFNVGNVTTYNPAGDFPYNTTVYVRIIPYNATGDATGCTEESFATQIAPPNCTTLSNPPNGATNVAVISALTWNAATGAPTGYKLTVGYTPGGGQILNNFNVGNVTTYDPPGNFNYNATVYVKIVPYNATGDATGCTEESFTTQIAPPNCTTLSNPANNATNVAVTANLTWNAATGAPTGYKLTVGYTPGGGDILNNFNVGNVTTYDPTGNFNYNATVYVKIVPYNATGDATGCTEESFTTEATPPPVPDCVTLSNPANGSTNVAVTSALTWNAASGAPTGYKLTVGTSPGGGQILNNFNVGNVTTYDPPGDFNNGSTVYVKVVPYNSSGDAIGCTETNFVTACGPPVPTSVVPGNKSVVVNWAAQTGATKYQLRYRRQGTTTWTTITKTVANASIDWLYFGTTYQYNLRAYCYGAYTAWSGNYTFTTTATPVCTLPYFLNHTVTNSSITVKWRAVPSPTTQELGYRLKGTSAYTLVNVPTTDTTYTITGLNAASNYQYRLRIKCGNTWSPYTPVVTAKTASSLLNNKDFLTENEEETDVEISRIVLSPNPVFDILTVNLEMAGATDVYLMDLNGKRLNFWSVDADGVSSIAVPVSALPAGVYTITAVNKEDGAVVTEKFVKSF